MHQDGRGPLINSLCSDTGDSYGLLWKMRNTLCAFPWVYLPVSLKTLLILPGFACWVSYVRQELQWWCDSIWYESLFSFSMQLLCPCLVVFPILVHLRKETGSLLSLTCSSRVCWGARSPRRAGVHGAEHTYPLFLWAEQGNKAVSGWVDL